MRSWIAVLALIVAACGAGAGPSGERSGMFGRVVLSPTCPGASRCPSKPVAATVSIEWSDGERMEMVDTDQAGRFRVSLPPGNYRVSARIPTEPDLVPRLTTVTVESDRYVRVEVVIGTRLNEP
jgi:hypothetical protein